MRTRDCFRGCGATEVVVRRPPLDFRSPDHLRSPDSPAFGCSQCLRDRGFLPLRSPDHSMTRFTRSWYPSPCPLIRITKHLCTTSQSNPQIGGEFWFSDLARCRRFLPHPPFLTFCCKQRHLFQSTLGSPLRDAWVALGPRLGHPSATQSQTQSQRAPIVAPLLRVNGRNPSRQRVATDARPKYQVLNTNYRFSRLNADGSMLIFKDHPPGHTPAQRPM